TVAVLGCGIDRDYPRSHAELARRIVASGAVVSEYPPGVEPAPWRFPARNRIIAGLSLATVVVEARERSGALITADFALELGRDVFAVPGEITSLLSPFLARQGGGAGPGPGPGPSGFRSSPYLSWSSRRAPSQPPAAGSERPSACRPHPPG